jgi:type IV secretory pathway VirB2 component (pilin)
MKKFFNVSLVLLSLVFLLFPFFSYAQAEPKPPAGTLPEIVVTESTGRDIFVKLQIPLPFVATKCKLNDGEGNIIKDDSGNSIPAVCNLSDYIKGIYRLLIGVGALLAVVMIMVAGYQWIFAGGSPTKIESAKKRLFSAVIGLMLALLSFVILNAITPRLVALRLPKIEPVKPFFTTESGACYSPTIQRQALQVPPSDQRSIDKINETAEQQLRFYRIGDEKKEEKTTQETECGQDYVIYKKTDTKQTSLGECAGFRCAYIDLPGTTNDGRGSCINKQCKPVYLWGNISWPRLSDHRLFGNRFVDSIQVVAICDYEAKDKRQTIKTPKFQFYNFPKQEFIAEPEGGLAPKQVKYPNIYEAAKAICGTTLQGFVLRVEVNDDTSSIGTLDDFYAVGKSGCALNEVDASTPFNNNVEGDAEAEYKFENIDFKESFFRERKIDPEIDFFSYADLKRGIQCDLSINDRNFPPFE